MARQTATGGLLAQKLGDRLHTAAAVHQHDEVEYSQFGELPGGIDGGIAQLIDCKFDRVKPGKTNAGEIYFYAAGVVKSPIEHGGQRIEGLRTSITEMVCDTPGKVRETVEDHLGWVQNQMKMLLGSGCDTDCLSGDELENTATLLKEAAPHFKFRTWKGDKQEIVERGGRWYVEQGGKVLKGPYASEQSLKAANPYAGSEPRVSHLWNGCCSWTDTDALTNGVDDSTMATAHSTNNQASKVSPQGRSSRTGSMQRLDIRFKQDSNADGAESPRMITGEGPHVIAELVRLSIEEDNGEAQDKLGEMAKAAGATEQECLDAKDWQAVADLIAFKGKDAKPEEESEDTDTPQVGQVWQYRPFDKKTKKPSKKLVQVDVVSIDEKAGTADLRSMENPKTTYKGVKLSELEAVG